MWEARCRCGLHLRWLQSRLLLASQRCTGGAAQLRCLGCTPPAIQAAALLAVICATSPSCAHISPSAGAVQPERAPAGGDAAGGQRGGFLWPRAGGSSGPSQAVGVQRGGRQQRRAGRRKEPGRATAGIHSQGKWGACGEGNASEQCRLWKRPLCWLEHCGWRALQKQCWVCLWACHALAGCRAALAGC